MPEFVILTNRKRAVIALLHSVAFLVLALRGFASPKAGVSLHSGRLADMLLVIVYVAVASILVWLAGMAQCKRKDLLWPLRRQRHLRIAAHTFRRHQPAGGTVPASSDAGVRGLYGDSHMACPCRKCYPTRAGLG